MQETEPGVYNVKMFNAAAATSAAPLYWNLKDTKLPDGSTEVLLDGGIIQNNPSIYALALFNAKVDKCIFDKCT
jgi:patatin-like phospholipase/acyl hydrolase